MKRFEERWRECVRMARTVREEVVDPLPGWAGIRARRREFAREAVSSEGEALAWWRWYGSRGLVAAAAMVVVCWIFAFRSSEPVHPWRPGVENAVAEIFWLL